MGKIYSLSFHQTFPPKKEYIYRLFDICGYSYSLTKEKISEITGIPTGSSSGQVEPMIAYAVYMGLIEDEAIDGHHKLSMTELGKEIFEQDPGFNERISLMLCHLRISSITGAELWHCLNREILPKYEAGIKEEYIKDEFKKRFGKDISRSPYHSSYEGMFKELTIFDKKEYQLKKIGFRTDMIYVYAYGLLYEWEQTFISNENKVNSEITADELESLNLAGVFGVTQSDFQTILEELVNLNIISINRQLVPYTLIKFTTSDNIIKHLYSLLN